MCRFIETICYQDGRYPLLHYHQRRVDKAFLTHFPNSKPHLLRDLLPKPDFKSQLKVRVVYDAKRAEIEWSEYHIRPLNQIKKVTDNTIEYAHKYENRDQLERLFQLKGEADEILVIKNGLVTDSFYANPVFWDGQQWYVSSAYLLNGVRRQSLIEEGIVIEMKIRESDIPSFQKVSLVNAMMNLGVCEIPASNIQ